jgi:hypothetical protein
MRVRLYAGGVSRRHAWIALPLFLAACGDETEPGSGFGGASAATGSADGGSGGGGGTGAASASTAGPGGGPSSFDCGPVIKCNAPTHYCEEFHSGVQGGRTTYECKELPAECGADPSCTCLASTGCMCSGTGQNGLTVTCLGA